MAVLEGLITAAWNHYGFSLRRVGFAAGWYYGRRTGAALGPGRFVISKTVTSDDLIFWCSGLQRFGILVLWFELI